MPLLCFYKMLTISYKALSIKQLGSFCDG